MPANSIQHGEERGRREEAGSRLEKIESTFSPFPASGHIATKQQASSADETDGHLRVLFFHFFRPEGADAQC